MSLPALVIRSHPTSRPILRPKRIHCTFGVLVGLWLRPLGFLAARSLKHLAPELERGWDTMDVWFDSGCSWRSVIHQRRRQSLPENTAAALPITEFEPANMYLEGHDQNRGWFQSSSLACLATAGKLPFRQFVTRRSRATTDFV